eukprot:250497_1
MKRMYCSSGNMMAFIFGVSLTAFIIFMKELFIDNKPNVYTLSTNTSTTSTSINILNETALHTNNKSSNSSFIFDKATNAIHTKNISDIETLYRTILNPNLSLCNDTYIESAFNNDTNEPDAHICFDNLQHPCYVLSFGIAYDFSFDDIMLEKGCYVWSLDPSMRPGNYTRHKNHKFLFRGIGTNDGQHIGTSTLWQNKEISYNVITLQTLMNKYNIPYVDIIRMDIESAEWDVLQNWLDNDLFEYIKQLTLEIHMYETNKYKPKHFAEIINKIPMSAFWAQKNGWNNKKIYKDMTQVYELDLIQIKSNNITFA